MQRRGWSNAAFFLRKSARAVSPGRVAMHPRMAWIYPPCPAIARRVMPTMYARYVPVA